MKRVDYRHTQIGWVIILSIAPVLLLLSPILFAPGVGALGYVVFAVVALTLPLFGTLRVTVDGTVLRARFGVGLIGKRVPLAEIRHFSVVKSPWYYGWGIRFIPGGVLYNVSGFRSVELLLKGGARFRLGSDEPDELAKALRDALGEPLPLTADEEKLHRSSRRKSALIAALVAVLVAVSLGVFLNMQGKAPAIEVTDEALTVRSGFYGGATPWTEITDVALQPRIPRITLRTNGYALGSTLRGHFNVDTLGNGELYIEADKPPFIVMRTRTSFLIVNDADAARTLALYGQIRERWSRGKR